MTEKGKSESKSNRKNVIVLKCNSCGKESRIRYINLYQNQIEAIENNNGCYCSKCRPKGRKGLAHMISAGDLFTVYPKVITLEELKEHQEGVNRAKDILERGLQQLKMQGEHIPKNE